MIAEALSNTKRVGILGRRECPVVVSIEYNDSANALSLDYTPSLPTILTSGGFLSDFASKLPIHLLGPCQSLGKMEFAAVAVDQETEMFAAYELLSGRACVDAEPSHPPHELQCFRYL